MKSLHQSLRSGKVSIPVCLAVLCLALSADRVAAAEAAWTGAVSQAFSNPGNWSTGKVPGPDDDAVFPAGTGDCRITADITVGSIYIADGYPGTVHFNTSTIDIARGHLRLSVDGNGHYAPGTATIRFTGSADQKLRFENKYVLHRVVNAKTGGTLSLWHASRDWIGPNLILDTLELRPGSDTCLGGDSACSPSAAKPPAVSMSSRNSRMARSWSKPAWS